MTKIFAFGDSYVAGYGVDFDECWVSRLEKLLNRPIANLGMNGAWITELCNMPPALNEGDVLLVLGGANDLLGEGTVDQVINAYESLEAYARKRGARAVIIVPPTPEIVDDELFVGMSMIVSLQEKMKELNERAHGILLDSVIPNDPALYIDGIHLMPEGHEMIARAVHDYGKANAIF